jgi:hypothetical protein
MDPHNLATGMHNSFNQIKDPGNAGTISVDKSPSVCNLVSAGAETRTLARPTREGAIVSLHHRTDGGDITVTITGGYDEEGTTTFTFTDPGQFLMLQGFTTDYTTFYWRAVASHVTGILSAQMVASAADALLSGTLAATAAEINRAAKNSTRPVAAGAASLTVTQALHDGKTIMLDQATGVAVTLPAMSGSGARYRFVCTVNTSGGSQVITATGAHLFGGMYFNTDTGAGTLFTAVAAANAGGSTVITLDGSTKGGRKGDWFEIEDLASGYGQVRGSLNGSGTEASPFS